MFLLHSTNSSRCVLLLNQLKKIEWSHLICFGVMGMKANQNQWRNEEGEWPSTTKENKRSKSMSGINFVDEGSWLLGWLVLLFVVGYERQRSSSAAEFTPTISQLFSFISFARSSFPFKKTRQPFSFIKLKENKRNWGCWNERSE